MNAPEQKAAQAAVVEHRRQALQLAEVVSRTLQPIFPKGWTGKLTLTVDNGTIKPAMIAVEYREQV